MRARMCVCVCVCVWVFVCVCLSAINDAIGHDGFTRQQPQQSGGPELVRLKLTVYYFRFLTTLFVIRERVLERSDATIGPRRNNHQFSVNCHPFIPSTYF